METPGVFDGGSEKFDQLLWESAQQFLRKLEIDLSTLWPSDGTPEHRPKRLFPAIDTHAHLCLQLLYSQQLGHGNNLDVY